MTIEAGESSHHTCVRRVPIFARLTPEQQDAVGAFAHPVRLRAGERLHDGGVGQLFVVHTGAVRLVRTSPGGRRHLERVAGPGEVVGEHAFLTGQRPDHAVEAAEDASLCAFAHADLSRLVARHPAIGLGMLRSLSERLADAERRLALAAVDVPGRLASHLLDLPGEATPDGWRVTLPWPKKDLASWLATTPESLSRALARLGRDGLVRVDGDEITLLDPDGLEGLASR